MSGSQKGETKGAGNDRNRPVADPGEKKVRKQRASDVGRALRSVYDDTLRESVPDDFLNLLGKLT